jgi:hypothetical protein
MFNMTTNCVVVIYSHIITYSHIHSQIVLMIVVVKKLTKTNIQIWLHDYNWTIVASYPSQENHVLA